MKAMKMFVTVAVASSLCAANSIALAQSADGPFGSKTALVNYWAQNANSQATEIALNGFIVYRAIGVGPANVRDYYTCSNGLIRPDCDSVIGPFSTTQKIVNSVVSLAGNSLSNTVSTLDGQAIPGLPAVPVGPIFGKFYYKTCYGDASAYGTYYRKSDHNYYVMVSGYTSVHGTFAGIDCLPQL